MLVVQIIENCIQLIFKTLFIFFVTLVWNPSISFMVCVTSKQKQRKEQPRMEISSDLETKRKNSPAIHGRDLLPSMINRYEQRKRFVSLLFCRTNISCQESSSGVTLSGVFSGIVILDPGPMICAVIWQDLFSSLPSIHVTVDVGPIDYALGILQEQRSALIYILVSLWVYYLISQYFTSFS